jgi:hypothetical protein
MSSVTSTLSMQSIRRLSNTERLNAAGLLLTAAAMLLQIAAGSTLYPSVTGPIVLVGTALAVTFVPSRWTAYLGLAVPLVLGVGAILAAAMTGEFVDQLTDPRYPAVFVGSVLHVVGLTIAIAGGAGTV